MTKLTQTNVCTNSTVLDERLKCKFLKVKSLPGTLTNVSQWMWRTQWATYDKNWPQAHRNTVNRAAFRDAPIILKWLFGQCSEIGDSAGS